jgi:hypothetical protein
MSNKATTPKANKAEAQRGRPQRVARSTKGKSTYANTAPKTKGDKTGASSTKTQPADSVNAVQAAKRIWVGVNVMGA